MYFYEIEISIIYEVEKFDLKKELVKYIKYLIIGWIVI